MVTYNKGMVGTRRNLRKRLAALGLIGVVMLSAFCIALPRQTQALELQERSLRLDSVAANAITRHTFKFSYASTSTPVGSLMFEYCTSPLPALPCTAPAGVNASGAVLAEQLGEGGYFILAAQVNRIVLTRAPSLPPAINPSQYAFDNVVNPDGNPSTFYVRITTHESTDASDAYTDFGAVVNAITEGVGISSEVPPILNFCVGLSIGSDCSSAEGNLIDLGDLSRTEVKSGTSEMMAATNALFGLAIAVYGTTMTSGNNIIPALAVPTPSAPGNSQFGINLRSNSDPAMGQDPAGAGVATPTVRYNTPNRYAFTSGDTVATSTEASDTRKFTATYIANVSPSQAPGVYTATLTYICTATF